MKKDICMNKLTYKHHLSSSLLAVALCFSAYSVSAATTTSNTDDGSAIGTSDTPQLKQQNKTTDTPTHNKTMSKKSRMHKNSAEMKMMDTNNDGLISKDEYMSYQEQKFDTMKQTDGMVNMKDMRTGANTNSMNNKPIGTTTGASNNGSVDVTKEGSVNGTHTGTN